MENRRDFLKTAASLAAALAGTSSLTSCSAPEIGDLFASYHRGNSVTETYSALAKATQPKADAKSFLETGQRLEALASAMTREIRDLKNSTSPALNEKWFAVANSQGLALGNYQEAIDTGAYADEASAHQALESMTKMYLNPIWQEFAYSTIRMGDLKIVVDKEHGGEHLETEKGISYAPKTLRVKILFDQNGFNHDWNVVHEASFQIGQGVNYSLVGSDSTTGILPKSVQDEIRTGRMERYKQQQEYRDQHARKESARFR